MQATQPMSLSRRRWLAALSVGGLVATFPSRIFAQPSRARIVIAGGGWGGLAAARHLAFLVPTAEITLIEREAFFWSCPLSNKWLVGLLDEARLIRDHGLAAARHGWRLVRDEVVAIARERRHVIGRHGQYPYDFLILAMGIEHDYGAWFGDDETSARECRHSFPAAWTRAEEFQRLRQTLAKMEAGELLLSIPPAPYRCPPAPFERALLLAGWIAIRKLPIKITVLDANPPHPHFTRLFREYGELLAYRPQTRIEAVDLQKRQVRSEFETFRFDHAILMPPQRGPQLLQDAGLDERDAQGQTSGWAAVDPRTLGAPHDERIFFAGDLVGRVSQVFGHYPKTAEIAVRQGAFVAHQIAARLTGALPPDDLPAGVCHLTVRYDPPEALRFVSRFRRRGDGEIVQENESHRDPQPRGEDLAWQGSLLAEIF